MVKQFLLNRDGSIPEGTNIAALNAAGIPVVLPTERWTPANGFELIESDPVQGEDGIWVQQWIEVPVTID